MYHSTGCMVLWNEATVVVQAEHPATCSKYGFLLSVSTTSAANLSAARHKWKERCKNNTKRDKHNEQRVPLSPSSKCYSLNVVLPFKT